jgi:hypothetical protein
MLKSEIVAEITAFYTIVGTPRETTSSDTSIPTSIKSYEMLVYETGTSEKSKKPVLSSKVVNFMVYNEGIAGEAAYYINKELTNDVNTDITGNSSLLSINKIYTSTEIRKRVQASVAKSAQDILNEATPSSLLVSNADASQKNVVVTEGFIFWIGQIITLNDSLNSEDLTIAAINSNTLTFTQNLVHAYTVANGGKVSFKDNKERQQWAINALLNPDMHTLCMTSLVSLDPIIQAAGGLATDNQILAVISSYLNKVASSSYT